MPLSYNIIDVTEGVGTGNDSDRVKADLFDSKY
jgi:hypothetical protein